MRLLRQCVLALGIAACSTGPVAPPGLHVSVEPDAAVFIAGDSLRVRVTITNEAAEPQRIVGVTCQASVDVYSPSGTAQLPVSAPRNCILIAGTTTVPPHGAVSDVLALATTNRSGVFNALPAGTYRLRGRMAVVGYGMLRSGFVAVTVSQ